MAQRGATVVCNSVKSVLKSQAVSNIVPKRCASLKSTTEVIKPPQNVLETMGRYQAAEATTPIHIVEGATDQITFKMTMGLCGGGLCGFSFLAYSLGFRK